MARGWESKHVEEQQAAREQREPAAGPATQDEAERVSRRRTLELARARAAADLAVVRSDAHRRLLEATLAAIDAELGG